MRRQRASPRPLPFALVVNRASNTRSRRWRGTPGPSSRTRKVRHRPLAAAVDPDMAAAVHRLTGVDEQVGDDAGELIGVGVEQQPLGQVDRDLDAGREVRGGERPGRRTPAHRPAWRLGGRLRASSSRSLMVFPERLTSVAIFSMCRLTLASETLSCSRRCATRNADDLDDARAGSAARARCRPRTGRWSPAARRCGSWPADRRDRSRA